MKKALDELLHRFLLVREVETFLEKRLRDSQLFRTELKLSDIRWGSHWQYDRDLSTGWIEALYVSEKIFPKNCMNKVTSVDLINTGLSIHDLYDTLNGSTAEKISIDCNLLNSIN